MRRDETFPLSLLPPRARKAILREFKGRCPSRQEVAEIPDGYWLSSPDIGPVALQKIRAMAPANTASTSQITDAELVRRLAELQKELNLIQRIVSLKIAQSTTDVHLLYRLSA